MYLTEEEYSRCSYDLVSFYHEDLSMDIAGEVKQFHNYLQSRFQKKRKLISLMLNCMTLLCKTRFAVFFQTYILHFVFSLLLC